MQPTATAAKTEKSEPAIVVMTAKVARRRRRPLPESPVLAVLNDVKRRRQQGECLPTTTLSPEQSASVREILANPPQPTEQLRTALAERRRRRHDESAA